MPKIETTGKLFFNLLGKTLSDSELEVLVSRALRTKQQASRARADGVRAHRNQAGAIKPKAEIARFLNGDPVSVLDGSEFQKMPGKSLVDRVVEFYEAQYGGVAHNPVIGDVRLDRGGVNSSVAHGIGSAKAAAFSAVPD
ncbi:MAG: hypothetical protein EOM15_10730, partial [Spirochaetia bacterium]|nr:hypothetical protein [Spirochaetia bacterium]